MSPSAGIGGWEDEPHPVVDELTREVPPSSSAPRNEGASKAQHPDPTRYERTSLTTSQYVVQVELVQSKYVGFSTGHVAPGGMSQQWPDPSPVMVQYVGVNAKLSPMQTPPPGQGLLP